MNQCSTTAKRAFKYTNDVIIPRYWITGSEDYLFFHLHSRFVLYHSKALAVDVLRNYLCAKYQQYCNVCCCPQSAVKLNTVGPILQL